MYIFGQIVDSSNRQPLRSASVEVLTDYYLPRLIGGITGADGYFDITNDNIQATDKLLITFVGYKSLTINVSDVLTAMDIFPDTGGLWALTPTVTTLPPVVITHPPAPKDNTSSLLIGGLLLLTVLASDNKKKRR